MIEGATRYVDGLCEVDKTAIVKTKDGIQEGTIYGVKTAGKKPISMYQGYYKEKDECINYKIVVVTVSSKSKCILSGETSPVGTKVYFSTNPSGAWPTIDDLLNNKYFELISNISDGTWETEFTLNYSGPISVWIAPPLTSIKGADLTCTVTQDPIDDSNKQYTLTYSTDVSFSGNADGSTSFDISFDYASPDDVDTIYLEEIKDFITCGTCGGTGSIEGSCGTCGGTGSIEESCQTCEGSGSIEEPCGSCGGTGTIMGEFEAEICPECGGVGQRTELCPICGGSGIISESCPTCGGSISILETCPECNGSGEVSEAEPIGSSVVGGKAGSVVINDWKPSQNSAILQWWCKTSKQDGSLTITVTQIKEICLSGDTLITLADYSQKRLDELTIEDIVLGGDMKPKHILKLKRGKWNSRHTLYYFDNETIIDEIYEHRFFNCTQRFWQKLKNWHIGDLAKQQDGNTTALIQIQEVVEPAEMFGIWVEDGSYWANGLLSGEASTNLSLLEDATLEEGINMILSLKTNDILEITGLKGLLP